MQAVSSDFTNISNSDVRNITAKVEIDWNRDGVFTDETDYLLLLEVERRISEPEGGVHIAMCDITLANESDRFTPPPSSST